MMNKETDVYTEDDNTQSWLSLMMMIKHFEIEWEKKREIASECDESAQKTVYEYLKRVLGHSIPQYELSSGTQLYRARQIKKQQWHSLKCCEVYNDFYRMFLSEDDISNLNNTDVNFSYQSLLYAKIAGMKEFDDQLIEKINIFETNNSASDFYGFRAAECGVPPINFRSEQRLSTKEDAYLYLALDRETAIYEMRPFINQIFSIGVGQIKKKLILADLRGGYPEMDDNNAIFYILSQKISEPNTDKNAAFYKITQYMSHILCERGFDGILYQSALHKGHNNVLLFDENNIEFISSEVVQIDDVHIDFTTQLPFVK